jgi:integrase
MKLTKPRKRGHAWRLDFAYLGERRTATFDTEAEAMDWQLRERLAIKDKIKRIESGEREPHTLKELLLLYSNTMSANKKGGHIEKKRISFFIENNPALCARQLTSITNKDLIKWRNARLGQVTDSTTRRDINLLSSIMSYAVKELLWLDANPFDKVSRPKPAPPRHRRISQDEIEGVLGQCGYTLGTVPTTQRHYVAWCFLFALETAMRASEIVGMRWENVHEKYVRLPTTKNGSIRNVPILHTAADLLALVRGIDDDVVVPVSGDTLKNTFRRVTKGAGIVDLNFHDTRHEAATRLARLMPIEDLSKVTGHKNYNELINTYYNPTANELADRMRKAAQEV